MYESKLIFKYANNSANYTESLYYELNKDKNIIFF